MTENRYILGEECEIIRALPNRNIGTVYMDPKYIEGQTLERYVDETGSLDTKIIYNIASSICDIIEHLYNLNLAIEYKDLKPSKIIITPNNKIILVDISLLKIHNVTESKYIAIHNIGKIIFYMAIGRLPFTYLEPAINDNYTVNMDNNLKKIIEKCFRLNDNNKYFSIEELNNEIVIELLRKSKEERQVVNRDYDININMEDSRKAVISKRVREKRSIVHIPAFVSMTLETFRKNFKSILQYKL